MFKAYLCLTSAMVIVGSSVVAGKIMVDGLPVFISSTLRFLLATVLLLPVLYLREGGFPVLSRNSWVILLFQALCGSFLFTVFLLYGLKYISPASAGIITSTTPAFMGLIGWIVFRERPSLASTAGIIFSVAGIMILNFKTGVGGGSFACFLLLLGAVAAESFFLVLRKWVEEPLSPLAATTIISLLGMLWFLPAGIYEFLSLDLSTVPVSAWCAVVYYGLVVTVLAYLFWFAGVVRVPASVAAVFTGVMPLSAVCLSALVLKENLGWNHLAGCLSVLAGIFFISGIKYPFLKKENIIDREDR